MPSARTAAKIIKPAIFFMSLYLWQGRLEVPPNYPYILPSLAKVSKPYEQCHCDGTVLTTQPQLRFVHFRSIFCILGLLAFCLQPRAQAPRLAVQAMDVAGNMGPWSSVSVDSLALWERQQLRPVWEAGLLEARFVTDTVGTDSLAFVLTPSAQYTLSHVTWGPDALDKAGERTYRRPPEDGTTRIADEIDRRLRRHDARGFPFARLQVSTVADSSGQLSTHIATDPGPLVRVDSVVLKSSTLQRSALISRLLGLQPGRVYNGQLLRNAPDILTGTGYLRSDRPAAPVFTRDGAVIFVYAERKKASTANAIIGFQPAADGSVSFTGQADLVLRNVLERGEQLEMHWRRLQTASQEFNLAVGLPYLFGSGVGIASKLEIFRQDSTFARIFFRNGVTFPAGIGATAEFYTESRQGSDLEAVTENAVNLRTRYYGLAYDRRRQDRPQNPRKGHWIAASSAFGRKTLTRAELNTDTVLTQFMGELHAGMYVPLRARWVVAPALDAGALQAGELAESELFVLGGLNTWRGFDEGFLRATGYVRTSVELRFLLDAGSHLLVFADAGWLERRRTLTDFSEQPLGIGTGLRFATGNGQFSLIYGLGRLVDGGFQLATGKVHFGFVSYF